MVTPVSTHATHPVAAKPAPVKHDQGRDISRKIEASKDNGITTEFKNNKLDVTGGAQITKDEKGNVTVDVSRTGPEGKTVEKSKTISAEQIDKFKKTVQSNHPTSHGGPVDILA